MDERWAIVLEANPRSWYIIKHIESIAMHYGLSVPGIYVLENGHGDVVAFVLDTTKLDEQEEASIMQALPFNKRALPFPS